MADQSSERPRRPCAAPRPYRQDERRAREPGGAEVFARDEDAGAGRPEGFGAEQEADARGGGAAYGPHLDEEGEERAENGEEEQARPFARAESDGHGPGGRPAGAGHGGEYGEDGDGGAQLDGGQGERVGVAHGPDAGHGEDVRGPDERGEQHEQVARGGGGEASALGEQDDAQDGQGCRGQEGAGRPGPGEGGLPERGEDHGEADDEPGVGGRRVHDAVRLQQEDAAEDEAEEGGATPLGPGQGAQPAARGDGERGQDQREAQDEDGDDGVRGGDALGGEVAGAPDDRDEQNGQVGEPGAAGGVGRCGGGRGERRHDGAWPPGMTGAEASAARAGTTSPYPRADHWSRPNSPNRASPVGR
ncbi:hypothetical protein GCM10023237_10970 [Streptomyces coeruleoprunus]